jgi:DNA-directed RNA polymerase specialized sigma24 family protein
MSKELLDAIARWKCGDESAQFELMSELQPFLLEMVRRIHKQLDPKLFARIDSQGVVYAALKSFLSGLPKGEFTVLENHEDVRRILTRLIRCTLLDGIGLHKRRKRAYTREQPQAGGAGESSELPPTVKSLSEPLSLWLEDLLTIVRGVHANAIRIVELSLEGLTNNQIADELGMAMRTVQILKQKMLRAYEAELKKD